MLNDAEFDALMHIQRADPNGQEWRTEAPSDADHAAHKAWAIAAYGPALWARYMRSEGWADAPEV